MKNFVLLFLMVVSFSCAREMKEIKGETAWQKEMNADFKDATKSPLKNKDRKTFDGLDFFKFDSTLVVTATLKRKPLQID